ncbi:MAG: helix-turn-helix domain-containing protein [Myxococcota bacterium]|nr:helix-turn-helix domain-containing protein [Myxococcota bacterium]
MPDPETSRQRILDAALELLAERGYEGMSLQLVADRVGLHKSTLFHHFRSKEEITREVYRDMAEGVLKRVEPWLVSEPPALEQILEASDALLDHFAAHRAAARLFMRIMVASLERDPFAVPADRGDPIYRLLVQVGEWLARARAAGVIRPVRVRHALVNLLGLVLFYPATAHDIGRGIFEAGPWSPDVLAGHKRELRAFLRGALEPL